MDPLTMQLRFIVSGGPKTDLSIDEWVDCLESTSKRLSTKLKDKEDATSADFLCQALSALLIPCASDPTLCSEVAQLCKLPALVGDLCRLVTNGSVPAVDCLQTLMEIFPGMLGTFKEPVELCLRKAVDMTLTGEEYLSAVSDCWAKLAFIGGGGVKGVNHKASWAKYASQCLGSLHTTLSQIFEHIPNAPAEPEIEALGTLKLKTVPYTNQSEHLAFLVTRFCSVSSFFVAMLSSESPTSVDLPVALTLLVVERTLSLSNSDFEPNSLSAGLKSKGGLVRSSKAVSKMTTFARMVRKHLPKVQAASLKILRALILCCGGTRLFEHSRVITRVLANAMDWSSSRQETEESIWTPSLSDIRKLECEAYICLETWIECTKGVAFPSSSFATESETPLNRIWKKVWSDFTNPGGYSTNPSSESISTSVSDNSTVALGEFWGLSKKEKKKRKRNLGVEADFGQHRKKLKARGSEVVKFHATTEGDEDVAKPNFLKAVKILSNLVQFCGTKLPEKYCQDLAETVVNFASWSSPYAGNDADFRSRTVPGLLQRQPDCRLALYDLLLSIVVSGPSSTASASSVPSSVAVSAFSKGSVDPCPEVGAACARALKICSAAFMRPPGLTMEWPRRRRVVEEDEEEEEISVVADDVEEVSVENEKSIIEVDRVESKKKKKKPKSKSAKKQAQKAAAEQEVVYLDDSRGNSDEDEVMVEGTEKGKNKGVVEVSLDDDDGDEPFDSASPKKPGITAAVSERVTVEEKEDDAEGDLPSVLDMLAAFTES